MKKLKISPFLIQASEGSRPDAMSLDRVPRDHRFISFRKLDTEARMLFQTLLDQLTSTHISSLNLLTVLACISNIARQRPEFMDRVVEKLEALQANLPPTLGTSQVSISFQL
jgi:symplekin